MVESRLRLSGHCLSSMALVDALLYRARGLPAGVIGGEEELPG